MSEAGFWETGLILRTLSGSRAQGLAREGSDTDTRGVCIPPAAYLIGLSDFEQHESDGGDHVIYSLTKFVRLSLEGNPNLLETLFAPREIVLDVTAAGERLLQAKELFLSRRVGARFLGYADGQRRRLERHHRWLENPPGAEPDPQAFGGVREEARWRYPSADQAKAYDAALKHWRHYETWRAERNPARAELERNHGYDTKHAMHLLRLLTMGIEVVRDGRVVVTRPDAEFFWSVRDGAFDYPELVERADALKEELEAEIQTSRLPDRPNRDAAEALVIELHREALS